MIRNFNNNSSICFRFNNKFLHFLPWALLLQTCCSCILIGGFCRVPEFISMVLRKCSLLVLFCFQSSTPSLGFCKPLWSYSILSYYLIIKSTYLCPNSLSLDLQSNTIKLHSPILPSRWYFLDCLSSSPIPQFIC